MNGSTLEDSPYYRAGGEHDPGEVRSELGPGEEAGISQVKYGRVFWERKWKWTAWGQQSPAPSGWLP